MAMLAEPKRKQKLSFDPRNKAWSNDTNKVGQQLMEKMGWKQGKGLGINEDGKTSHIGVSLKNNTLGLGCSQEHEDNWISHQDDFNDLLTSLNQDHKIHNDKSVSSKPQSLQEKSKKAKKRVHYKKFTAGKDLSMYGDNAMNCIMGVRSKSNTPHSQSETNSDNDANSDGESTARAGLGFTSSSQQHNTSLQDNFGVQTITSTNSMQDYFAQKMKELREKRKVDAASNVKTESEDTVFDSITIQQDSDSEENTHKKKKKKSKRKKDIKIEQCTEEVDKVEDNNAINEEIHALEDGSLTVSIIDKKKKKKRKKPDIDERIANEDEQHNQCISDGNLKKQKKSDEEETEKADKCAKKKAKRNKTA